MYRTALCLGTALCQGRGLRVRYNLRCGRRCRQLLDHQQRNYSKAQPAVMYNMWEQHAPRHLLRFSHGHRQQQGAWHSQAARCAIGVGFVRADSSVFSAGCVGTIQSGRLRVMQSQNLSNSHAFRCVSGDKIVRIVHHMRRWPINVLLRQVRWEVRRRLWHQRKGPRPEVVCISSCRWPSNSFIFTRVARPALCLGLRYRGRGVRASMQR